MSFFFELYFYLLSPKNFPKNLSFYYDFLRSFDLNDALSRLKRKSTKIDEIRINHYITSWQQLQPKSIEPQKSIKLDNLPTNMPSKDSNTIKNTAAIQQINDLFPNLSEDFIIACLKKFNNNFEETVNSILENKLPDDLIALEKSSSQTISKGKEKITEDETSVEPLSKTEKDTISNYTVKATFGKRSEKKDALSLLDDKSEVHNFKYKYEDVYEDEFDDSYEEFVRVGVPEGGDSEDENIVNPNHEDVSQNEEETEGNGEQPQTEQQSQPSTTHKVKGQTFESRQKTKNKAIYANHNRKKGFDKKMRAAGQF